MLREQKASGVAEPAVSFMELAQRLTRKEAVKLFMQVREKQYNGQHCEHMRLD